jgi:hypothetical protein
LLSCHWILRQVRTIAVANGAPLPYFFDLGLTREAVVYAAVLAIVSATVAGVIPAIRITGKKVLGSIRKAEAGRSGIRFGGITSAFVAADVAIAITAVGLSLGLSDRMMVNAASEQLVGVPADEYLAVSLRFPAREPSANAAAFDHADFRRRVGAAQQTLVERLRAEPGVRGVAIADTLPRMDHRSRLIDVEGIESSSGKPGRYMRTAVVDVEFFEALDQPILAGRDFDRADVGEPLKAVIVNTEFVERILGGENPIGRRLRLLERAGLSVRGQDAPWAEIVGVVGHLGMNIVNPEGEIGVYLPAAPGAIYPMRLGIHLSGAPESFVPTLRELVEEVDPAAVLAEPVRLSEVYQGDWYLVMLIAGGLAVLVVVLVALAASGIFAMVSFSVSERTREIGIRNALGASRRSLALTILRRSLWQIGIGALIGTPLAWRAFLEFQELSGGASGGMAFVWALACSVSVVLVIGLFSCLAPARRALRIDPSEALRSE